MMPLFLIPLALILLTGCTSDSRVSTNPDTTITGVITPVVTFVPTLPSQVDNEELLRQLESTSFDLEAEFDQLERDLY